MIEHGLVLMEPEGWATVFRARCTCHRWDVHWPVAQLAARGLLDEVAVLRALAADFRMHALAARDRAARRPDAGFY